ncbi:MAG: PBP1A family penicillin-binding protein [Candidatus Aquicultorales bacterium]
MSAYRERAAKRKKAAFKKRIYATIVVIVFIALLTLSSGVAAFGLLYAAVFNVEDLDKKDTAQAQTTKIFAADGTLITQLFYDEDREVVPLKDISRYMQMATIAIEDERFYEHQGYDPRSIMRAISVNLGAGEIVEGASTITQQLVKHLLLTNLDRSVNNKLQEAIIAYNYEKKHKKNEILENYLNTVFFGQNFYGIETASLNYFGKHAKDLTLPEAAALAGIIRSPNNNSPYVSMENATIRRDTVLKKMADLKMITKEEYLANKGLPLTVQPPKQTTTLAPYFVEYVKQQLLMKYGDKKVFKGGLRVYTTIDLVMQSKAEQTAWNTLAEPDDPSVSIVSVDPRNGYIRAMVGGKNFDQNKFNLAAQSTRQPGSTFKTFVVAAALEKGISPSKTYESSPLNISLPGSNEVWQVRNYSDGPGSGPMTLRAALIRSVNCVFARLVMDVGPAKVVQVAEKMGITTSLNPYPSIALGSQEVSPLEMASAYGTIANGGMYVAPTPIVKITDAKGKVIEEHQPKPAKAIEPVTAAFMIDMMRDVISSGTGTAARIGRPAAGKTGTAERYRDAWFVGFTPELSTSVWVGYPQGQIEMYNVHGIPVTGGSFPARIWGAYMAWALEGVPISQFPNPADQGLDVTEVEVCAETGQLPRRYCPRRITRAYPRGGEPTDLCQVHTKPGEVRVPAVIGLTEAEAIELLKDSGFYADVHNVIDPSVPRGQVITQSPDPDSIASQDTTVTITVSAGP